MTQAICDITTDEVNVDVVVEPQADTMVEVANRAGGMEQAFHDNTLIGNGNSVDLGVNTDIIATKEYVDNAILSLPRFRTQVVDSLPLVGEERVLYLVKKTGTDIDSYDEYIWVPDVEKFEFIGTTQVNLTGYATTDYVDTTEQEIRVDMNEKDSQLESIINEHATAITNLEDGVDSINGKIPTNASTTNLLVSTSQLNTEIQDVRADFMADDAALQTQINGQATTIAGIQDDITGINSKISNSASSTNKLVSASELSATEQDIRADMNETDSQLQTQITAQAAAIAGKQDQLTAGDNITIVDNVISATGGGGGDFLPLAGGTMTGNINFEYGSGEQFIGAATANGGILISFKRSTDSRYVDYYFEPFGFFGRVLYSDYKPNLGNDMYPWGRAYIQKINSGNGGEDIIVPTEGGTLARLEDVATKQDQLVAGDNIVISGNTISATGAGGGAGFDIVVVQELPATGQKGIIYLLAKDGAAPDVYDEYVWIESTQTFELIGTTQVDLTDYATKEELGGYLPTIGGTMTGALNINREGSFLSSGKFLSFTSQTSTGGYKYTFSFYTVYGSQALYLSGGNFYPFGDNQTLGSNNSNNYRWKSVATRQIYNGSAIDVPTKGGTMALLEDINAIGGNGTEGQVLTKTETGMAWANASGGDGDIDCGVMS